LIIAEGLTLYLTPNELNLLLNSLDLLITDDSEIIISFVGKFTPKPRREARLKQAGEGRLFSIRPEHVIYYVHQRGFEVKDKFTSKSSMTLENEAWIRKYYENTQRRGTAYYTLVKAKSGFTYKSMDEVPEIQLDLVNIINQKSPTNE
jgi:O-methyltransferase involved in polyketide biosynthesis